MKDEETTTKAPAAQMEARSFPAVGSSFDHLESMFKEKRTKKGAGNVEKVTDKRRCSGGVVGYFATFGGQKTSGLALHGGGAHI